MTNLKSTEILYNHIKNSKEQWILVSDQDLNSWHINLNDMANGEGFCKRISPLYEFNTIYDFFISKKINKYLLNNIVKEILKTNPPEKIKYELFLTVL